MCHVRDMLGQYWTREGSLGPIRAENGVRAPSLQTGEVITSVLNIIGQSEHLKNIYVFLFIYKEPNFLLKYTGFLQLILRTFRGVVNAISPADSWCQCVM